MANKQTIESEMTINREGAEMTVEVSGIIHFTVDNRYGEDADGNRGVCKTIVHEVLTILATDDQLNTVTLTKAEEEQASYLLTRKFLEE